MFGKDEFCAAVREAASSSQARVEALLQDSLAKWRGPPDWLEHPTKAGIWVLSGDSIATIMHIVWPGHMITEPHNHNMWASIALYQGRENNMIWERSGDTIVPSTAHSIGPGEVFSLGKETIHSVHNPIESYTGAIHVYGGDFMGTARSEWDPLNLEERPRDMSQKLSAFLDKDR